MKFDRCILLIVLFFLILCPKSYSQEPILMDGWPILIHEYHLFSAPMQGLTLYDIDGDGDLEIFMSLANKIYCFDYQGNAMPGWPYVNEDINDEFANSPVIGDIDGDGTPEIVVDWEDAVEHHSELIALETDGTMCSGFPIDMANNNSAWQLALYDLDGDGAMEIIIGLHQSYPYEINELRVYNGQGEMLPGWPIEGLYTTGLAIGDIDNDNSPEIIVSGAIWFDYVNQLFAYEADGTLHNGFPMGFGIPEDSFWVLTPPNLFDYNDDNFLEISQLFLNVDNEGYAAVVNESGELLNGWPLFYGGFSTAGCSVAPTSVGSNEYGISFGESIFYGYDYLVDTNAHYYDGWPFWGGDSMAGNYDQPTIGDIDGDGSMDYIFNYNMTIMDSTGQMGRIWALNQDGELLDYFPLWVLGTTFPGGVSLGDIDNDGITEMAFETDYPTFGYPTQRIYVYKLDVITWEPERFPWPMSCHDPQHTNNLTYHPQTGVPYDDQTGLPRTPYLYQNYPNPFNAATTIKFGIPRAGKVKLDLYDLGGRKVAKILEGDYPAGDREIGFDGSGLPSGLYFYRLRFGDKSITRKMILLK